MIHTPRTIAVRRTDTIGVQRSGGGAIGTRASVYNGKRVHDDDDTTVPNSPHSRFWRCIAALHFLCIIFIVYGSKSNRNWIIECSFGDIFFVEEI